MNRINPWGGTLDTEAPPTDDEITDQYLARRAEAKSKVAKKGLSPAFGRPDKRRAQLVARLKRRRKYGDPVKGGTGRHKRKGNRKGHFK